MQISAYYQKKRCPKLEKFGETLSRESRQSVFGKVLREACELLASGTGYREVLLTAYERLKEGYGNVDGYYDWQAEVYANDDVRKLRRFFVFLGNVKFLRANVTTAFMDGDLQLEGRVSLVFEKAGKTYLAVIRPGKCDRSAGGKSLMTKVSGDLRLLVAKHSLESLYPGIVPWCVYMTHPDDKDEDTLIEFSVESTKNTNLTVLPISGYIKNGVFSFEKLAEDIRAAAAVTPEKNCDACEYASLCKVGEQRRQVDVCAVQDKGPYVLPRFTPAQMQVVEHKNGPLLVCAGAGSGKTAALVGRIAHLVKTGVSPNTVLCLTFGRKAAEELSERCMALFDSKGKPPKITTIHGLAFDVLRSYGKEVYGTCPRVLDDLTQTRIVERLLSSRERISGFKYEVKVGPFGLFNTVLNRMKELGQLGENGFRAKHPEIGEAFYEVAKDYLQIVKNEHYVAFDEMVSLAVDLFQKNPEILSLYQLAHQYVMVDEFQDVSKDQAEFVYLLASSHKNLVVVGDDDQCIYRWRGAVPSYMVDFPKLFHSKTVVFRENFRSTNGIVKTAQKLIRKNPDRIDKNIVSSSGREGEAPSIVHSTSTTDFRRVIAEMLDAGYHYGDISIIARTNKTLKSLKDALGCPCAIAKTFLRHDSFFNFVRSVLDLFADPSNAMAFSLFSAPFGLQESAAVLCATGRQMELAKEMEEFHNALSVLDELFDAIRQTMAPKDFIEKASVKLYWDRSDAPAVLLDEFRLSYPESGNLGDLREYCREVYEYQSDIRVCEKATDAVTLITNHDVKGLEFPVILLHSDYAEKTAEERSLFYVGLTRAKEKCVVFESPNAKTSFLSEIFDDETGAV